MSWRDRNLKFGPNCDLEVDNFFQIIPLQITICGPNFKLRFPPAPTFRLIPRHVIKSGHTITPRGQKTLISRNLLKTMDPGY